MSKEKKEQRLCLSVDEFARAIGIGRSLAYRMVNEEFIRTLRFGRRILVPKAEIERLVGTIDAYTKNK